MEVDPNVGVAGVCASAGLIRNAQGVPVLAIDDMGNVGILGELREANPKADSERK